MSSICKPRQTWPAGRMHVTLARGPFFLLYACTLVRPAGQKEVCRPLRWKNQIIRKKTSMRCWGESVLEKMTKKMDVFTFTFSDFLPICNLILNFRFGIFPGKKKKEKNNQQKKKRRKSATNKRKQMKWYQRKLVAIKFRKTATQTNISWLEWKNIPRQHTWWCKFAWMDPVTCYVNISTEFE